MLNKVSYDWRACHKWTAEKLFIGSAVHLFELLLFLCIDASDRIATKNYSGSGGPLSTALVNMQNRQQVMQFLEKKTRRSV
jgi:hypothetical protein